MHRIGLILLEQLSPTIIVPVCPDYGYEDGRYTFRQLGSGVPLSVVVHTAFLERVQAFLPCKPHFLIADQEAEDGVICRAVGVTQSEFARRVGDSLCAIRDRVTLRGWLVSRMTEAIPELSLLETVHADHIRNDRVLSMRVKSDAIDRKDMYWRINRNLTVEDMLTRTVRTMAQYRAIGSFAADHKFLIANHTTTNLAAYADVGAALIHNPVAVY